MYFEFSVDVPETLNKPRRTQQQESRTTKRLFAGFDQLDLMLDIDPVTNALRPPSSIILGFPSQACFRFFEMKAISG